MSVAKVPAQKFPMMALASTINNKPCWAFLVNAAGIPRSTSFEEPIWYTSGANTSVSNKIIMHEKITPIIVMANTLKDFEASLFFFRLSITPKNKKAEKK